MVVSQARMIRKKAFETMYNRHFHAFYVVAFHFLHRQDDAQQVVQEAFIKLWEGDVNLESEAEVKNYLFIVIRNRCLNLLRDRKKMSAMTAEPDHLLASINYRLLSETGEDVMLFHELSEKIQTSISNLPPQCREVFSLSRFEDLTNKEIADKLAISVKAVEANITRALRKLREDLAPYLDGEKMSGKSLLVRSVLLSFM